VSIYLDLLQVKICRTQYIEAEKIHRDIHPQILKGFAPDSVLAIRSMELMALIYHHLFSYEEAEKVKRHLLQITLNKYGIKSSKTLRFMADVAEIKSLILDDDNETEFRTGLRLCEKLLHTAIQINRALPRDSETTFAYQELCRVYRDLENYEESNRLTKEIIRSNSQIHGSEYKQIIGDMYWLAKGMKQSGDYERAESIFRFLVLWMIKLQGLSGYYLFWRIPRLADALLAADYVTEAARRYEEGYRFWTAQKPDEQYIQYDIDYWPAEIRKGLRKAYSSQGLYSDPASFEARLEAVKEKGEITTVHLERERKWCRFERDQYSSEVEYQPERRRRGLSWIQVD